MPAAVDAMVEDICAAGPLTGLVNNAAGNFISRTEDLSPRGFDAIANIVMHGTFYVTQAVGKRWIAGGHKGSVVSIVVTWVRNGGPVRRALGDEQGRRSHAMTQSLAIEWGRYGIRLNAIAPGVIPDRGREQAAASRRGRRARAPRAVNPMGRVGRMEELQNLATFLMADGCDWLTGETIAHRRRPGARHRRQFLRVARMDRRAMAGGARCIKAQNDKDRAQRTA